MRSYPLWIDGVEEAGKGWTYVIRASELIRDPAGAFTFKRQLELGKLDPVAPHSIPIEGRCAWGDADDCRRAVASAARARDELARWPLKDRAAVAAAVHDEVEERVGEIIDVLVAEGHPRRVAEWEVSGMATATSPQTLDWVCAQLEQELPWNGCRLKIVRKPDGVVCVNPPQNASAANGFLGALAMLAGNTLVVRAPQSTPLGVMYIYHEILRPIYEQYGVPRGALNVISGEGRSITKAWLADPHVDSVFFFGDSRAGLRIGQECVARGKKALLELSGNDGLVVWRDADLDGASTALLECFYGSAQICMVPKFAIVHPSIAESFLKRFVARVRELKPGYPEDRDTVLTPVFRVEQFAEMLAEAKQEGADVLCGGRRLEVNGTPSYKGLFVEPTVVRVSGFELAERLTCVREETFFPLLPIVVPAPDEDAALLGRTIDFLNANRYGLRNSLWSQDAATIERFTTEVRNGGLLKVNSSHVGFVPYLATHGGVGESGGPYGEMNHVSLRLSRLQGIQIAP